MSCEATAGLYVMTAGHAKFSWGSGGTIRLPAGPGQGLGGDAGDKAYESFKDSVFHSA